MYEMYIGFWKVVLGGVMNVIEKFRKMTTGREKENKKFAKLFLGLSVHRQEQRLHDV